MSENDEILYQNTKLFQIIRKNYKTEEHKLDKIKGCVNDGANINVIDKNDKSNTLLHIAVKKNYASIVKFLLEKGITVKVENEDQKTPLDLAEDNKDICTVIQKSCNVPGDGNCLFWAVALAYLTPVKNDDDKFEQRFSRLFGPATSSIKSVQDIIQKKYNPFLKSNNCLDDAKLKELVTEVFRSNVVKYLESNEDSFKGFISGNFDDYLQKMKKPGAWGGQPELEAMHQILNCAIYVHSESLTHDQNNNDQIMLYHINFMNERNSSRNHYEFAVDINILDDYTRPESQEQSSYDQKVDIKIPKSTVGDNKAEKNEFKAHGLKKSLHGDIYQLKLTTLFLIRGFCKGYSFDVRSEVAEAGLFDDIVLEYKEKNDKDKTIFRFVQVKHTQNENNKIRPKDIMTENEDDFSVKKYFISYNEHKKKFKLENNDKVKDFIIFTNYDLKDLEFSKAKIKVENIESYENDKWLNTKPTAKYYKLKVDTNHKLYEILMNKTTVLYRLAEKLAMDVANFKPEIKLAITEPMYKKHRALLIKWNIIDMNTKKLHSNFISNRDLSKPAKKFRGIFYEVAAKIIIILIKLKPSLKPQESSSYSNSKLPLKDLPINELKKIVKEFISKWLNNEDISLNIFNLLKDANVIKTKTRQICLDLDFIYNETTLENFRDCLLEEIKEVFFNMILQNKKFIFTNGFEKMNETELAENFEEDIVDVVSDKDIKEFFKKLVFAVNQPNEVELGQIIERELKLHLNLVDSDFIYSYFILQVLDWMKGKTNKPYSDKDVQKCFSRMIKSKMLPYKFRRTNSF